MSEFERLTSDDVVIAGGGPAGTSLAIRLAMAGRGVSLVERAEFPRHKLCGEFISPECISHFRELGVLDGMMSAGGDRIGETVFYSMGGRSASIPSSWFGAASGSALGLSRAEMDLRLLQRAKGAGVRVFEGYAVTGITQSHGRPTSLVVRDPEGSRAEVTGRIFVDATGRQRVVAKQWARLSGRNETAGYLPSARRDLLVGFKAHFRNADLAPGRCEIYFFPGGYGGLSHVEGGVANHCFLVKAKVARRYGGDAGEIVENVVLQNRRAGETLAGAVRESDWLAVSVSGFGRKELIPAPGMFTVGDAGAFIDPFTGSGMLMALESAKILADAIVNAGTSTEAAAETYQKAYEAKFGSRLRLCAAMRRISFRPVFAGAAVSAISMSTVAARLLARSTRNGVGFGEA